MFSVRLQVNKLQSGTDFAMKDSLAVTTGRPPSSFKSADYSSFQWSGGQGVHFECSRQVNDCHTNPYLAAHEL